jgi:hypothetical protein
MSPRLSRIIAGAVIQVKLAADAPVLKDGFLKHASAALNAPPHHMGLRTRLGLSAPADVFALRLKSIETEPLAEIDWYTSVMENRHLTNLWLRPAYYKIGISRLTANLWQRRSHKIPGHTILAIYEKI